MADKEPWAFLAHDNRRRFQILAQCTCCKRFVDGVWKAAHTTLCDDCHTVCQTSRFVGCRIVKTNLRGVVVETFTAEEALRYDRDLAERQRISRERAERERQRAEGLS